MSDNQQIIVEHIVNIDTTAQNIDSINAVAGLTVQISALAGMLPDVAATVQMRATLLAVAKKLTEIKAVSDALPLMAALEPLVPQVSVIIGMRPELAAVTGQMDAIRRLSAGLDTLLLAPEHAAQAEAAAEKALTASSVAEDEAGSAEKSRLGAEFAEDEAKAARDIAVTAKGASETARDDARKAADAAAAVSGLPDASTAAPGDPIIWDGSKFAMGALDDTLQSVEGTLGLAEPVQESISTAYTNAEQALTDAAAAKTTAEGVDAKATQALADATEAKTAAESAGTLAGSFDGRLAAAETETLNVGTALAAHTGTSDIHTPKADIEALAAAAANRLKDGGDGSALPADRATLLALSGIINDVGAGLEDFLSSAEPGKRMAILAELDRLSAELSGLGTGGLTRADVVNALDSDAQDVPLAAAQGPVLVQKIDAVQQRVDGVALPWIQLVDTIPETWPDTVQRGGLLLKYVFSDGQVSSPEWYTSLLNSPVRLALTASDIRLADGTTVQSGVASTLAAAQAAQTAATAAQSAATDAKNDAAAAKTTAEGVDGKATQALADATEAKTEAASAKAIAEGIDAKAVQAQADAAAAKTTAEDVDAKATQALADAAEALAKSPDLATQTTPGIVKGSETVTVDEEGALHAANGVTVVSPPTVTVPSQVGISFPFDIELSAGPVLLPGASVISFEVSIDGGEVVTVPAVEGAATLSHTPQGDPGAVITISTVVVESMGNRSVHSIVQVAVVEVAVEKPRIIVPETGSYHFKNGILIATSPFSASAGGHTASKYEIEDDEGNVVYSIEDSGAQTTHTVASQQLIPGKTYSIFVSHRGEAGAWSPRSDGVNVTIRKSVVFGGGTADGGNSSGFLSTSPWPGNTWTNGIYDAPVESGQGGPQIQTIWGKEKFLVVHTSGGKGGIAISDDGVHFTAPRKIGDLRIGVNGIDAIIWRGLGYGDGIFTACGGDGNTTYSDDAITWSTPIHVLGQDGYWSCVAYGAGRYVVCGDNGKSASSPDMKTWTPATVIPGMAAKITSIAFVKNMFVAGDYVGKMVTSKDGLTWSNPIQLSGSGVVLSIVSDGNSILAVTNNSKSHLSTDGISWSQYSIGDAQISTGACFINGEWFAANHTNGIVKSTDGKTWTKITPNEQSRQYYTCFAA